MPFLVAPFALLGAMQACRGARKCFTDRIWIYLAARLLVYWLVWAKAAPSHGYYNLQNLVLFSALFGMGVVQALRGWRHGMFPIGCRHSPAHWLC